MRDPDGAVCKHPRADMFNILTEKASAAKKGAAPKPLSEVTADMHNYFQSKQYLQIENNIHPCKQYSKCARELHKE